MNPEEWLIYGIIIIVLILISLVVKKLMKKDFGQYANKLLVCLGGKENILNAESNMSRLKILLKDVSIVDKDGITKMGAKGIVEIDNQLKIIFGPDAKKLKRYVDELL